MGYSPSRLGKTKTEALCLLACLLPSFPSIALLSRVRAREKKGQSQKVPPHSKEKGQPASQPAQIDAKQEKLGIKESGPILNSVEEEVEEEESWIPPPSPPPKPLLRRGTKERAGGRKKKGKTDGPSFVK